MTSCGALWPQSDPGIFSCPSTALIRCTASESIVASFNHQLRLRWPDTDFRLNGEIDKGHPYFVDDEGAPKTDMLVHIPGGTANYAAIEVWFHWTLVLKVCLLRLRPVERNVPREGDAFAKSPVRLVAIADCLRYAIDFVVGCTDDHPAAGETAQPVSLYLRCKLR